MSRINDCLFHCSRTISNHQIEADGNYVKAWVRDDIIRGLSDYVYDQAKIVEHKDRHCTEYRASVYVINPDDFWRIVQEEALRMNMYMGGRAIKSEDE